VLQECPHCHVTVLPTVSDECPSCRQIMPRPLSVASSLTRTPPIWQAESSKTPLEVFEPNKTDAPEEACQEESFGYTGSYKFDRVHSCGWPALTAGLILSLLIWVIIPSDGRFAFKNPSLAYLCLLGSLAWLAVNIIRAKKAFGFSVGISKTTLRVGDKKIPWSSLSRYEVREAKDPAVIVYIDDSTPIEIPRDIEGLGYIVAIVRTRVGQ
jgi:hypothetical protein